MENPKLIVNIDGPRGVGKSTQIGLLSRFFKEKYKVSYNFGLGDSEMVLQRTKDAISQLDGDTNIVINEGSFFRPIAEDFQNGMDQTYVLEKHKESIELNEKTRHPYQTINIILSCDNTVALEERLVAYSELTGHTINCVDTTKEADLLNRMIGFEKNMVVLNANTKILYLDVDLSILEVNEILKKEITSFL